MSIIAFGDYSINESNRESDYDKLLKLSKFLVRRYSDLDKDKYPFQILVIYCIASIFGYNKILNIVNTELSESSKDIIYSYIMYGSNKYFDGTGFFTKDDILTKHNISDDERRSYTFKSNLAKLKELKHTSFNDSQLKEFIGIIKSYKN